MRIFHQVFVQPLAGLNTQGAQFFGAADEVAFPLRKLFAGGLELALRLGHVFAETDEFVVEPAAFFRNGEGVLVLLLVAPEVGDSAQGGQQRTRACQHDAFVETFLEEAGIVLQGEQIGGFDGDEHKHEVQRVDAFQIGIVFLRQVSDMGTDAGDVGGEFALGGFGVGGLGVADVGGQRDFGIDDDLFAFGQVDEDVGLEAAGASVFFLPDGGGLDGVFALFAGRNVPKRFLKSSRPSCLGFCFACR